MIIGIIFKVLFLAVLVVGACFLFFFWLNSKSSNIDDKFYDENFDAGDMVANYKVSKDEEDK